MKKITIILLGIFLTSIVGYFVMDINFQKEKVIFDDPIFISDLAAQIGEVWRNGEVDGDQACKDLEHVDSSFYQCHPKFMQCLLQNDLIKIRYQRKTYKIKQVDNYQYVQQPTHREYLFLLYNQGDTLKLRLKDGCRETYLPNRYYPSLLNNRSITIEWDNFSKNIFVDKFLTRVWEVRNWANFVNNKEILKKLTNFKEQDLVTNLLPKEMDNFCAFQGKQVISARVHDAMAIHPEDIANSKSKLFRAPYYPWSRKNSVTNIFKLQKGRLERLLDEEEKLLCKRVYALECLKRDFVHYANTSVTWSGAFETMGGAFEYVRNIINPSENINLSSWYYPWKSKAHRLGVRGYWDEEGFSLANFNLSKYPIEKKETNLKVAFRCMRNR